MRVNFVAESTRTILQKRNETFPNAFYLRIVILDRLDYCANTKNFESMVGKLGIKISHGVPVPPIEKVKSFELIMFYE